MKRIPHTINRIADDLVGRKYIRIHRNPNPSYKKEIAVEVVILERFKAKGRDCVIITPKSGAGELTVEERCLYDTPEIDS